MRDLGEVSYVASIEIHKDRSKRGVSRHAYIEPRIIIQSNRCSDPLKAVGLLVNV